jgi:predicted 3-demethylubiquinone-9 3-methyltransferase (glyoxalase superfamily)
VFQFEQEQTEKTEKGLWSLSSRAYGRAGAFALASWARAMGKGRGTNGLYLNERKGRTRTMQKITTFLTYNNQAEEAAKFYVSIFKNSRIGTIVRFGEAGPAPAGTVMTVSFELEGQEFVALNGGPHFKFTEGVSLYVDCQTQEEVDTLWTQLSQGGEPGPCGWLKDKFGLSWQIIPTVLGQMLGDPDPKKSKRVMEAMLQMKKIIIKDLQRAYQG